MKKIIEHIKNHRIYFLGYSVSAITYFSYHGPQMQGLWELGFNMLVALFVGFTSWAYIAARVINAICA
jgi:hypothetical protein